MSRPLAGMGIVITGATSGIGRALATALAGHGSRLVVVARDREELEEVVKECHARGASAMAVALDIADADAVESLGATAAKELGSIETWVNAAAVLIVGRLPDLPAAEIDRTIRTNVLGTTLCSRVALQHFEAQGRGVLIETSSLLGVLPNPSVPLYCATKFAVRGLAITLHEGYGRRSPIRVCTVLPGPVDTPMFENAANHLGRELRSIPPAMSPDRVAAAIVRCIRRPRRQVTAGMTGWGLFAAHRVAPRTTEWAVAQWSSRLVARRRRVPITQGALFRPPVEHRVSGEYRRSSWRRSLGDLIGRKWAAAAERPESSAVRR